MGEMLASHVEEEEYIPYDSPVFTEEVEESKVEDAVDNKSNSSATTSATINDKEGDEEDEDDGIEPLTPTINPSNVAGVVYFNDVQQERFAISNDNIQAFPSNDSSQAASTSPESSKAVRSYSDCYPMNDSSSSTGFDSDNSKFSSIERDPATETVSSKGMVISEVPNEIVINEISSNISEVPIVPPPNEISSKLVNFEIPVIPTLNDTTINNVSSKGMVNSEIPVVPVEQAVEDSTYFSLKDSNCDKKETAGVQILSKPESLDLTKSIDGLDETDAVDPTLDIQYVSMEKKDQARNLANQSEQQSETVDENNLEDAHNHVHIIQGNKADSTYSPPSPVPSLPHRLVENAKTPGKERKEFNLPSCSIGNSEEEELFDDRTDLAYLLDNNYLKCWKDGIIFNHPQLYFSVKQIESVKTNRQAIETKVSNTALGYRVLGFIVNHIRTLVKEWYPGFSGSDGEYPYIMQCIACPICNKLGMEPYLFGIEAAFERVYKSKESDYCIQCIRNHCPQIVNVDELCPELMFKDLPSSLLIDKKNLMYEESDDFLLGSGGYGKVYRGMYKSTRAAVKLYKFDESDITTGLDSFYEVRQEIFILSKLRNHPYIVQYLGFALQPRLCAVMELADQGTLKTVLYDQTTHIQRIVLFRIAQQLASALKFMHSKNIIHRDIKSDNVLLFSLALDAPVNVKLTDFGTANFMSPTGMKDVIGTHGFMAPEMFDYCSHDEYSSKVDVYSLAMVLYEIITLRKPFHDLLMQYDITDALKTGSRPMFCDVPRSFYGLLTMTDLMINMWQQEPVQRPTADGVLNQLTDLSFQLLYGKRALDVPQNPRFMCYVPSAKEIWIVCDDRKGAFVTILDMRTSKVKEVLTIDGANYGLKVFNLVHICLINEQQVAIVMRGTHDAMLTFSVDKHRNILNFYAFDDVHVTCLIASHNFVYIGYQHGSFERIPKKDFLKGKFKKDAVQVVINEHRAIPSMIVNESKLIIANDKYLYQYQIDLAIDRPMQLQKSHQEQPVREIIMSQDQTTLFVSYQCSPEIFIYDTDNLQEHKFSCLDIVKRIEPYADNNDTRVTCMCQVLDVLWVGTGSGHILIFKFDNVTFELTFINHFQPYSMEMRKLCLVQLEEPYEDGVEYLMLSSGKQLNERVFGSFCKLQGVFPLDKAYVDRGKGRSSPTGISMENIDDADGKVILIWQVLDSHAMIHITTNKII